MSTALMRRIRAAVFATARIFTATLALLIFAGGPRVSLAAPAAAEPAAFTNALLMVYPEYDDPRLLIMLEGSFSSSTSVPATVRFLIPAGAEFWAAASIDAQGKYIDAATTRKVTGLAGWDEITFDVTTNRFVMEYYHDAIQGLPDKSIAYEFRSLYPIDSLQVDLLQPARATNFSATPPAQSKGTSENMTVHRYRYANVGVDKPLTFNVSYTKPDSTPSVNPKTASAASPAAGQNLFWLFGLGGAALVTGGAIWYSASRRRYRAAPRGTAGALWARGRGMEAGPAFGGTVGRTGGSSVSRADLAFCRNCGTRLEATVRFCPRCGTQTAISGTRDRREGDRPQTSRPEGTRRPPT